MDRGDYWRFPKRRLSSSAACFQRCGRTRRRLARSWWSSRSSCCTTDASGSSNTAASYTRWWRTPKRSTARWLREKILETRKQPNGENLLNSFSETYTPGTASKYARNTVVTISMYVIPLMTIHGIRHLDDLTAMPYTIRPHAIWFMHPNIVPMSNKKINTGKTTEWRSNRRISTYVPWTTCCDWCNSRLFDLYCWCSLK